ncbi:FtsX-like permease family protein [Actinosynnema sp. NPDC050436]|uniref:FtsX-like permease family protein n=1 Tax=Actinosynnema sp. NPDC050436 TaxID=3155659 RepID=UPI0033CD90CC
MYVGWRDLRFARGRFALMGTVIVLITLLVGLLSGLTAGLGRQNTSAVTGLPADRIAFGGPEVSFADSAVTDDQVRRWAATPGVRAAEPLGVAGTKASAARNAPVTVFGVRPGSALAPVPDDRSAVLSEGAADELGAGPGDAVVVAGRSLTVAAVRGDAWYSHTPVVWTTADTWRLVAPPDARAATVVALTTDPSGVDFAAADAAIGTRTTSIGDALAGIGSYTSENGSLQLMRGFLFAISALVIGAFFTVWTIQRSGDVAVLKALGASTGNLLRDALGQAVVVLVGGTLVGTGLAVAVGAALAGSSVPFLLTPATVLPPAAATVLLGAAGAALAVRRVTSVDPLTALGAAR